MIKHISEVADELSIARHQKEAEIILDPLSSQLVDQIFIKMALICRGFDSFYADKKRLNAEKTQWILAFSKLGIRTKPQIQLALTKLESYKFPNPPQLGEFLDWRKLSIKDLGFPEIQEAFYIANRINMQFSTYKHEDERVNKVIQHAISQMGSSTLREMKVDRAMKTFESYYTIALSQYLDGKLGIINKMVEDNSSQTKELLQQDEIVMEEYKGIRGNEAIAAMKAMLL